MAPPYTYRVKAPMVLLKVRGQGGKSVVNGFYEGAMLPPSVAEVDPDNLERHIGRGWVEEVDEPVDEPTPEPVEPPAPTVPNTEAVPTGTAAEVVAWVGNDRDRAQRALAAEKAAEKPRTTLIDQLAKLAEPPAAQD